MSPASPPTASATRDVLAAGAVVLRKDAVLLVHRPRYDDWSFPKGKLDRGELAPVAAVREVSEETGVRIRLGMPLASQRYPNGNRMKSVSYWVGRVVGDPDVGGYLVNDEIDDVAWVPLDKARKRLSYSFDVSTLKEALAVEHRTHALVVLRHSHAFSRKAWRKDDRLRPLLSTGRHQAERLTPLLSAYAPSRLVTSSSLRCVQTVAPYAAASGWPVQEVDGLSEEDATAGSVVEVVDELLQARESALLCTHRPVLPTVLDALGIEADKLAPGELLVVHHRKSRVRAVERY
ncbi:NUDIX hydrolase [Nocardioides islandensis]|uniref:NUDIX hydrolase n=1 Tax=Nocardioides islandensis TaxID=433663 RepID=A0A930VK66_9ACTN|nr:NUDIX hydrolase [Nocardioides islandensis]MBF4765370.1 NUDIX hydrolase [Nocardioides islandensis]